MHPAWQRATAQLHYTGSGLFNRYVSRVANQTEIVWNGGVHNLSLSAIGIRPCRTMGGGEILPTGDFFEISSEAQIFELLEIKFMPPEARNQGKEAVIDVFTNKPWFDGTKDENRAARRQNRAAAAHAAGGNGAGAADVTYYVSVCECRGTKICRLRRRYGRGLISAGRTRLRSAKRFPHHSLLGQRSHALPNCAAPPRRQRRLARRPARHAAASLAGAAAARSSAAGRRSRAALRPELFNNMKTPASILAGALIGTGFLGPLPEGEEGRAQRGEDDAQAPPRRRGDVLLLGAALRHVGYRCGE